MVKIMLEAKTNSFIVNGLEFQKGSLRVNHSSNGISINGSYAEFNEVTIDGNTPGSFEDLKTWISENLFKSGGGSGGDGAVNSVTGDLVAGTASDPTVNLPDWVKLLRDDRIGYLNSTSGMTFQLSAVSDAVKFLSPTPLAELNLKYPTLTDKIKKVALIFNCDVDLINNSPLTNAFIRNIPTKAKQYDCWTLMYDSGDRTWDFISVNSMPKWYIDQRTPAGTERDIRTWDAEGNPVSKPIAIQQLTDIASFPPFANGVFCGTAMNAANKTGLLLFIEFSTDTPKAGTFPSYKAGGKLAVNAGTDSGDAINLGQLSSFGLALGNELANKADLENGKVPENQLPSYIDNIQNISNFALLPNPGENNVIYITTDDAKVFRWNGQGYTQISSGLVLGETMANAYRGDRGKTSYDHSQLTGNPHGLTKNDIGLGNINNTADTDKPVSTAQQAALNNKTNYPGTNEHVGVRTVAGAQGSFPFAIGATPNSFPFRNASGVFQTGAPTIAGHVANKEYVDGYIIGTSTTSNGVKTTNFTNRIEYTCLIPFSVTVPSGAARYLTQNSNRILPAGVTIDGCDEHYISVRNNERGLTVSIWDNATRNIYMGFGNTWSESITATGSVSVKLIKYK